MRCCRTVQGKLEERLPFMSLTFPESFKQAHPQLYRNLQQNVDRLSTPFDLHETLLDLLDVTRVDVPLKHNARGAYRALPPDDVLLSPVRHLTSRIVSLTGLRWDA